MRSRPTYASVTATLALVVACSGGAYAAGLAKNSVGTAQLKSNAVTSAKIKDGQVAPADLSAASRALAARGPVTPGLASGAITGVPGSGPNQSFARGSIYGSSPSPSTGSDADANVAAAATLSPSVPTRVSGLRVQLRNDVPDQGFVKVEVVVSGGPQESNQPGVLTCTVTGTAGEEDITCASTGSGVIPASRLVYVRATVHAGVAVTSPSVIYYGMTLAPA